MRKNPCITKASSLSRGYTLIELMIVIAVIAVIVSLALPVYTDYSIRAKVGEALSVGAAAKTAVSATCIEDPTIDPLTNSMAGYSYAASQYVDTIESSGTCLNPVVTVTTKDTGAETDIVLTLTGNLDATLSRMEWICTSNASDRNVPRECRS